MGEVLQVDPPRRLSYVFRSGPYDPPTTMTWQLRATDGGTAPRAQVDEIDGSGDDDAETPGRRSSPPCGRCSTCTRGDPTGGRTAGKTDDPDRHA